MSQRHRLRLYALRPWIMAFLRGFLPMLQRNLHQQAHCLCSQRGLAIQGFLVSPVLGVAAPTGAIDEVLFGALDGVESDAPWEPISAPGS